MASGSSTPINAASIKLEPGTTGRNERLASLKIPRDLTLGNLVVGKSTRGGGAAKKVFTPNLNVTRNKNQDVKTSRELKPKDGRGRGRGERGRGSDRGRGGRGGLIQTQGLFSEGAGASVVKTRASGGGSSGGGGGSTGRDVQLVRPTINRRDNIKVDPDDEQKHLDETIPDDDEDLDDNSFVARSMPILLNCPSKMSRIKKEMKSEGGGALNSPHTKLFNGGIANIKQEKLENDEVKIESKDCPLGGGLHVKKEDGLEDFGYPDHLSDFFSRKSPQIFLLQLPDTLPGQGPEIEPAESAEMERPTTPNPQASFCTARQLEEGLVGKILRYKSGKTKLLLGDMRFDISLGMDPGFVQQLIAVKTNTTERSGNLMDLGEISAKLNAAPDWEHILQNTG